MGSRFWTPARDARLRELWGTASTAEIARRLGVSTAAVKTRVRKRLGLPSRRERWTPQLDARLRVLYPTRTAAAIAVELGRTTGSVYRRAAQLRLEKHPHWPAEVLDRVRRLNAEGLCDRLVAERVGPPLAAGDAGRDQAKHIRQRLGLPFRPDADARRRSIANQRKTLGIRHGGDLRAVAHARYARANGWPDDLPVRAVQILNVLCQHGPKTARQLAEAIGMPTDQRNTQHGGAVYLKACSNSRRVRGHGTYTGLLKARGLVQYVHRAVPGRPKATGCRVPGVYSITAKAIALHQEILDERNERGA